ncbi:hypothetical protein I79_006141 [Cricetulus griseus]|uniref:Uncharacterized protein n=1 Tax=Cricetulus griseus TaxID=10029 RepID=G3H716_CRIGR|nr:hypothetical protein I79_006141 [Cricetulus griseus]
MTWSMTLLQPGSVMRSKEHVATKDPALSWGLVINLRLCWCPIMLHLFHTDLSGLGCPRAHVDF